MTRNRHRKGFTLIELMIGMAIVSILAAIAYPNYRAYVVRANRGEAQSILLRLSQDAERWYTANNTYVGAPLAITQSPPPPQVAIYTIAFQGAVTRNNYTMRATPVTSQANKNDGYMELTSTGIRRWQRPAAGTVIDRWVER